MRIRWSSRVEQEAGQRLAQLGLADAGRARGTGTSRTAGSDPTGPRASGGSRRTPRAPPRPGRPRARAARSSICSSFSRSPCIILRHRDAGRARHHLGDLFGADLRAQQLAACRALSLGGFSACFSCASSCGSLPYCSSATFCQSPLRLASSISQLDLLDLFLDVLRCPAPAPSRPSRSSSRSAYSRSSRSISSSIRPRRLLRGLVLLLLHRLALDLAAGSGGGRAGPSPRAWSRSPS